MEELTSVLSKNPSLTKLSLLSCNVDDKAVEALAKALPSNTKLRELNLGVNGITAKGVELLVKTLFNSPNTSIKTVDLFGNNLIHKTQQEKNHIVTLLFTRKNITLKF